MDGDANPKADRLSVPEHPMPEGRRPEGALSLRVNVDGTSNRGLSLPPIPSPLPSSPSTQAADPPSRVQTANNSQESPISSQPPSAEHFLRDLITPTETTSDALLDALRRLKRPHDGEGEDGPLAKRDRQGDMDDLKDELEELHAIAVAAGIGGTTGLLNAGTNSQPPHRPTGENSTTSVASQTSCPEVEASSAASAKFDHGKTPDANRRP